MRPLLYAAFGAIAATVLGSTPAFAGKNDDAWAQCLWSEAPRSASNWIAMEPVEVDSLKSKDPYSLLALRLEGFCREKMIPAGKKYAPDFKAKSVRTALIGTKPAVVANDVSSSNALRCEIFEDDVLLGVSLFYGDPSGLRPRLPATAIKCQRVNDDGTLTDA